MKSLFAFGIIFFALAFCGITDRIKQATSDTPQTADSTTKTETNSEDGNTAKTDAGGEQTEKPNPTAQQQEMIDNGNKVVWEDQGMGFVVPKGWNKIKVSEKLFNYGSPATGFLIVNISTLPQSMPIDISLKAAYDAQLRMKNEGKVDMLRYLEIDDIKGVEFIEAMPEDKSDSRRHHWIGYRNYNNQVQLINIILSTKGSEFNDKSDTLGAILYSMKFDN